MLPTLHLAKTTLRRTSLRALCTSHAEACATLGVPAGSPDQHIKRAFLERSLKHHPDISTDQNAALQFRSLVEARNMLLNANRERSKASVQSTTTGKASRSSSDKATRVAHETKKSRHKFDAQRRSKKRAADGDTASILAQVRALAEMEWADRSERCVSELNARERELEHEAAGQAVCSLQSADGQALSVALPRIRAHLRKRADEIHVQTLEALKPVRDEVAHLYELAALLSKARALKPAGESRGEEATIYALTSIADEEHRALEAKLREDAKQLTVQLEAHGSAANAREAAEMAAKLQVLRGALSRS